MNYDNLFFKTSIEPDVQGHFGGLPTGFGGQYVPELLIPALLAVAKAYEEAKQDPAFKAELIHLLQTYVGRPSPLYFAERLTQELGGAQVYFKNEGLNHTGAHKINHCIGQALLAKRMGKTRLIAETGAGQHGVATATVAARFGLKCTVHMGKVDMQRQAPNVFWMKRLGAEVIEVTSGSQTLKDAVTSALQDYMGDPEDSYYVLGSALGPHPYPMMVRDFQSVIGLEVKQQLPKLPDILIACVGGGSNAIGLFNAFIDEPSVRLIGVEAAGAARLSTLAPTGIIDGYKSAFLQDEQGNVGSTSSIAAGLDYPGIGPEHALLHKLGRSEYVAVTDEEALNASLTLAKTEGIIPALESAHAVAHALKLVPTLSKDQIVVVNLSGRGDKDYFIYREQI